MYSFLRDWFSFGGNEDAKTSNTSTYDVDKGYGGHGTGSHTENASVDVAGLNMGTSKDETKAKYNVDGAHNELSVTNTHTQEAVGAVLPSVEELSKETQPGALVKKGLVDGPRQTLEGLLKGAQTEVWGMGLDDAAMDQLRSAAQDTAGWGNHNMGTSSSGAQDAWEAAGKMLRSMPLPHDFEDIVPKTLRKDPDLIKIGMRITQYRAITRYLSRAGDHGLTVLYNLLHATRAKNEGTVFEWPADIEDRDKNMKHFGKVMLAERSLGGLLESKDGASPDEGKIAAMKPIEWLALAEDLFEAIDGSDSFKRPDAQRMMLERIHGASRVFVEAASVLGDTVRLSGVMGRQERSMLEGWRARFEDTCASLEQALSVHSSFGTLFVGQGIKSATQPKIKNLRRHVEDWNLQTGKLIPRGSPYALTREDLLRLDAIYKHNEFVHTMHEADDKLPSNQIPLK
jgi:hypothetical protein